MIDLKRYMSEDEKELINQILDRAEMRFRKQQRQHSSGYQFLRCQCEIYEQMPEEQREIGSSKPDRICQFCQDHGCCRCSWKGDEREEEEDEDPLPF